MERHLNVCTEHRNAIAAIAVLRAQITLNIEYKLSLWNEQITIRNIHFYSKRNRKEDSDWRLQEKNEKKEEDWIKIDFFCLNTW